MNWDAIGAIGEIAGALAVVGTLAYLALQIKQNTNSAQSQSRQTLIDGWAKTQAELSREPELLRIYACAIMRWSDLLNVEKTQFDVGMGQFLANLQNGILLRNAGMLDQATLETTASFMLTILRSEGGAKWWQETGLAWPETRAYLDERLAQTGDGPTADELVPHWMALASEN